MFFRKRRQRERIYRWFTIGFLIIFVLSVAAALIITGVQVPTQPGAAPTPT